jgi:hypothetical protein
MLRFNFLTTGTLIALFCCFAAALENSPQTIALSSILEALEKAQAHVRPQGSYQVIREYRLFGENDSSASSEVVAEVDFRPPASKDYRIQKFSGSKRGEQLVRRILEHEVEAASNSNQGRMALNRDNYDFNYNGEAILNGRPCYVLVLRPKRRETDLVSGEAWIDKHSFLVRQVEGELAKAPSWWLKRVRVKLTFADVSGTWLQTRMEAVADVRVVGSHTLTSRVLDYRRAAEVASASSAHHRW